MPNPMTQEQLVDICRLMDINKDGLVDLNEFLESFRLAEKSLHEDEHVLAEMKASWHELDRCPSKTAVDADETGVDIELLKLDDDRNSRRDDQRRDGLDDQQTRRKVQRHNGFKGAGSSRDVEEIELLDYERPKRPGLLESDI